jgi:hypothetical protein
MNYKVIAILVICIAAVAASGCTGLLGTGSGDTRSSQGTQYSPGGNVQGQSEKIAYTGAAPVQVPTKAPDQLGSAGSSADTKIIKTASLTIQVGDVPAAAESLKGIAAARGGYISSTNVQKTYNNRLSGTVVLRIPAAEFENALAGVKAIGTVKSLSTQGQDVTEEYVDLQAQKTSYQNQLAQYNEIMKKAEKVEDVITVQQQIDRVQTELNRLDGRIRYLNSRIDLSTITVDLEEPEPVGGETGFNIVSVINEGISGFLGMIGALIIIFFSLLPLIIIGGAAYWVYRWKKAKKPEVQAEQAEKK